MRRSWPCWPGLSEPRRSWHRVARTTGRWSRSIASIEFAGTSTTRGREPAASTGTRTNSQSFHDGVDIQVPDGTPVYSIAAGEAFLVNRSAVAVVSPWGSAAPPLVFGYWHVDPAVADHQQIALHGLLGYVRSGAGHVHLSELRFGRYVNPLRVGGLSPYVDRTAPVIRKIALRPVRAVPRDLGRCGLRAASTWS